MGSLADSIAERFPWAQVGHQASIYIERITLRFPYPISTALARTVLMGVLELGPEWIVEHVHWQHSTPVTVTSMEFVRGVVGNGVT